MRRESALQISRKHVRVWIGVGNVDSNVDVIKYVSVDKGPLQVGKHDLRILNEDRMDALLNGYFIRHGHLHTQSP